jgi:hypothetical protein
MFKFAESGIVAWPTEFPVDQDGLPTPTKVLVRYRVLTREELRQLDREQSSRRRKHLAEAITKLTTPLPEGDPEAAKAQAEERARQADAILAQATAEADAQEVERTERLLARVVSVQPPGESDFHDFAPGELARQLEFEVLATAYEKGLVEASRAAVAKN